MPTDLTVRVHGAKGPLWQGPGPAGRTVQQHVDALVTELVMFLTREVRTRTPQGVYGAQGGLLSTIQGDVVAKGTPAIRGLVASASPYAEVAEKGRRPGAKMPPAGSLLRWLEVKLGLDPEEAARVEYRVRRKIGLRGFEGKHMFERAVTENGPALDGIAARYGARLATELTR